MDPFFKLAQLGPSLLSQLNWLGVSEQFLDLWSIYTKDKESKTEDNPTPFKPPIQEDKWCFGLTKMAISYPALEPSCYSLGLPF